MYSCFLFLQVLRCFNSLGLLYPPMNSASNDSAFSESGSPIRISPGQRLLATSPRLIAGCYVLHRLLLSRHPPYALNNLTTRIVLANLVSVKTALTYFKLRLIFNLQSLLVTKNFFTIKFFLTTNLFIFFQRNKKPLFTSGWQFFKTTKNTYPLVFWFKVKSIFIYFVLKQYILYLYF